jgi:glutathione S-transferase
MDIRVLPPLLTPLQVASWLKMPTIRVKRMARSGQIPALLLPGGEFLFDQNELLMWLDQIRDRSPSAGLAG